MCSNHGGAGQANPPPLIKHVMSQLIEIGHAHTCLGQPIRLTTLNLANQNVFDLMQIFKLGLKELLATSQTVKTIKTYCNLIKSYFHRLGLLRFLRVLLSRWSIWEILVYWWEQVVRTMMSHYNLQFNLFLIGLKCIFKRILIISSIFLLQDKQNLFYTKSDKTMDLK